MKKFITGLTLGMAAIVVVFWLTMSYYPNPEIQNLPYYTLRTVLRISLTLFISIVTGLFLGILAATNRYANMTIVPFFDVLQSVPILGYFPMVIVFFVSAFPPPSELGIELAAILLLFTSMMWAVFFGVISAVKSLPSDVIQASQAFGITGFQNLKHVIIPAIVPNLIAGGTLAWSDGWFFMIAAEYFTYGGTTYFAPGLGSYLAKAAWHYRDMDLAVVLLGIITMLVIYINFLTWHRLSQRVSGGYKPLFRADLHIGRFTLAGRVRWTRYFRTRSFFSHRRETLIAGTRARYSRPKKYSTIEWSASIVLIVLTFAVILYLRTGSLNLELVLRALADPEVKRLPLYTGHTLTRLAAAYSISLVIAISMGVLAAENKKFAMIFYPIYDVGQAVPILALFPILFITISRFFGGRVGLEITAITMLVLDMIWYLFQNIVTAVKAIPEEIKEVGRLFGFRGLKRITHVVIPAILPAIVTGSMLSWGTGWNTVIFAEYMPYGSETLWLPGIGYFLGKVAYEYGNTVLLFLVLSLMTAIVIGMEKLIWNRLLRRVEKYGAGV